MDFIISLVAILIFVAVSMKKSGQLDEIMKGMKKKNQNLSLIHISVLDLIADKKRKDLFPVGRLDLDTEGLLLITNDGDLAHRLLLPKKHVDKVYYARCRGTVREGAAEEFARRCV